MDALDCEIDARNVFKPAASDLSSVKNLNDSLARFGFSADDRIDRRELVTMYSSIAKETEAEISHLAHDSSYDSAKEMRARLTDLKNEFTGLQTTSAQLIRDDQASYFSKAAADLTKLTRAENQQKLRDTEEYCERLRRDQRHTFEIQRENLELQIANTHRPSMKYSKQLIELLKSESSLITLCQYEEAKKVRAVIDRILPVEQRQNELDFEESNEKRRRALKKCQAADVARLEERVKAIICTQERKCEKNAAIQSQRILNNERDMNHAHASESKLRPEMSVKPSSLWQKRRGYASTSSSLRGQQLLDCVRGNKKKSDVVFAESLVNRHDFETHDYNY